jgi:RNA polymerase sigma-70 factor, ECF subfamily
MRSCLTRRSSARSLLSERRRIELAYADLTRLAENRIRYEAAGISIDATGLAHEAFLQLAAQHRVDWENRSQFFAIAARAGSWSTGIAPAPRTSAVVDTRRSRYPSTQPSSSSSISRRSIERSPSSRSRMRFFGGLTIDDTALALSVSPATVKREWAMARAWLKRELEA